MLHRMAFVLTLVWMVSGSVARGDSYLVTLNTSSLIGNPNGPFVVSFQLTDGSFAGDGNNTVTLSAFDFGGGTPGAVLASNVTGDLSSAIVLTDTDPSL